MWNRDRIRPRSRCRRWSGSGQHGFRRLKVLVQRRAQLEVFGAGCFCFSRRGLPGDQVQQLERVQFLTRDRLRGSVQPGRGGSAAARTDRQSSNGLDASNGTSGDPPSNNSLTCRPVVSLMLARDRDADLVRINQDAVTGFEGIRPAARQTIFRRVEADAVSARVFDVVTPRCGKLIRAWWPETFECGNTQELSFSRPMLPPSALNVWRPGAAKLRRLR